jgi:hypothetical protein
MEFTVKRISMSQTIILGWIAFSGDLDPDPDAAAVALRKAGFAVTRLPAKFRPRLCLPRDDFLQATIGGTITNDEKTVGAVMAELNAIVRDYGGDCSECEVLPLDNVPSFDSWFEPSVRGRLH